MRGRTRAEREGTKTDREELSNSSTPSAVPPDASSQSDSDSEGGIGGIVVQDYELHSEMGTLAQ